MDLLERFPRAWCDTCETMRPIVLDMMKAKEKHDHDAADITRHTSFLFGMSPLACRSNSTPGTEHLN